MHIVIFTGGSYPEPHLTEQYFNSFPPEFVIAADSGLEAADAYQTYFSNKGIGQNSGGSGLSKNPQGSEFFSFCPAEILGDMDSLKNAALLKKYSAVKQTRFIEDKDYTDTELALKKAHEILNKTGPSSLKHRITLVGGGGTERLDHLLGIFDVFSTDDRPDVWISGSQAAYYVHENQRIAVSGMAEKDMLSFARLSGSRTAGSIKSEGLLWESDCFRSEGLPSISNRLKPSYIREGKSARFEIQSGAFLLMVPLSAKMEITVRAQEE